MQRVRQWLARGWRAWWRLVEVALDTAAMTAEEESDRLNW